MDDNAIKLPEEVGKAYKPAPGIVREFYHAVAGRVDLNKTNMQQAKKLAELGILIPVKESKEEKK